MKHLGNQLGKYCNEDILGKVDGGSTPISDSGSDGHENNRMYAYRFTSLDYKFVSKLKLFKSELVFMLAIIVVRWVKISGMLEKGSKNLIQNRYLVICKDLVTGQMYYVLTLK